LSSVSLQPKSFVGRLLLDVVEDNDEVAVEVTDGLVWMLGDENDVDDTCDED
jgi:hypothetical protein